MTITRAAIVPLFATVLLLSCAQLHAQDEADATAPAVDIGGIDAETAAIDARVESIRRTIEEFNRLDQMMENSGPGIEPLFQRRKDDKGSLVAEEITKLVDDIIAEEAATGTNSQYRPQVIEWLNLATEYVRRTRDRNSQRIIEHLGSEASMSAAEAAASTFELERAMEGNVWAYKAVLKILDNLERLGEDVSAQRALLLDKLRESAELLAIAVRLDTERLQKLRYRVSLTPTDEELLTLVKVADLQRDVFARQLGEVSTMLEQLGDNPSEYRSLVLVVTGDVASQILDTGVMSSLAKQWSKSSWDWISENGLNMIFKIIVFVLIILGFRALSNLVRRAVQQAVSRGQLSRLLRGMIVSTARNIVLGIGIMIAFSQMGVSLGPLLAGLGVLGFIIGFALQDTLGNFAAGMMILIYRPYDVGDVITAAGITGKVEDMSLVYTLVLTFDNQRMVVPNGKIWGDVIQNVTAQRERRVDLMFGIAYSDDIDAAEAVFKDILDNHEMVLKDPEPTIKLHMLDKSAVQFIVRPWVRSKDYWDVYWDVTREVKLRLDKAGISIPFEQRDVHIRYDELKPAPE